jgi:hypothetical protein
VVGEDWRSTKVLFLKLTVEGVLGRGVGLSLEHLVDSVLLHLGEEGDRILGNN